jgi:hypothetical protein
MISKRKFSGADIPPDFSKRFWYGVIENYYPSGFLSDISATCDSIEELKSMANKDSEYSYQVFWDNVEFKELELSRR